ncbi:low molecular weight protein-tyrosine-phosphatase [Maritalea sp.]|uniref:low molecular weight protein-tyrosine-phosphatase n=1 Tax=Maritalea sp. TaxID=2003361 RepID=UPI003EF2C387
MAKSILFVCLGNICRSPTAEAVFTYRSKQAGLTNLTIDSAGTGNWHQGHPPDIRATKHAKRRNYELSVLRARTVKTDDFEKFDLILAMDNANYADLKTSAPTNCHAKIELFLTYGSPKTQKTKEVPDPYYGGDQGFEHVLDLIEDASDGLIKALTNK